MLLLIASWPPTNYNTSLFGENVLLKKILIPIYLPWSTNLGGAINAKELVGNGQITYAMLFKYGS